MVQSRLLDTHEQAVEILNRAANSYHVVSTFAGKMFLNFMFSEPSISQKKIEIIADDAIAYLKISVEI
jgi:hypothetical protein